MSSAPHREHTESARGTAPGPGAGASPEAIEAALADLDPEQREAVTHGEGPLLIVAGAGTGKTQVITRRIAWLIASRRAKPDEILALTFTNKAAAEMEARVDELVPYGFVGATIATFNAFCDQLVREHAVELGITSQLRVESEAEILVFLREHLFELGLRRYLPLGRPETHLHALASVFDRARNEDVSAARWIAFAERLAAEAGDDPVKRDRAEAEREKAGAFAAFEALMLQHGRIDFGSQSALALRLLRERPHVLRQVQSGFRWLLVDEFQDTSHAQFELVKLLAARARGITVVGDDDQSIYRFRGARVENLLEFLDVFPGAREVLLRRNYRSGQSILDRAHRLIRHNDPERLEFRRGIDKRLLAQRKGPEGRAFEGVVEHRAFRATRDQADVVAGEIAEAVSAGVALPSQFAILARSHGHLDPFALALKARGVRFTRVGMRGLYSRPEVLMCLNALRSVAAPDDGASVYMLLGDARFGADPVDLARLGAQASRKNRPLLRLAQQAAESDGTLTPATRDAVRTFAALHRELTALAVSRPASEVLYAFVAGSGMLESLGRDETPENVERAQNLNKLFGIVARVGPLLARDRVDQFIHHLDLLIEMGDDPVAAELEGDEQAVRLLTAHAAKGLEFPTVYMVDLVERRFPTQVKPNQLPFPPELRHTGADDKADHEREERRLFYVGMTRARDRLVLCHARQHGGVRPAKPSRFVLEALDLPAPPRGATGASALESIERYAPVAEPEPQRIASVPPGVVVAISHTSLYAYQVCPWKYYLARVANVPLPAAPAAMYGRALHHAIKVWHQHRMKGLPIETADVIGAFESAWSSEGFLTPSHEERLLAQGREALEAFVRRDLAAGNMPVAIESEFRFRVGHDEIDGRFDRIDERADGVVLVDYKSSQVQSQKEADERTNESLKSGQLGLYALAYRETRGTLPAHVELHFIGAGLIGAAAVADGNADDARDRAVEAAAGIRAGRFDPTPDLHRCARCDYRHVCAYSAAKGAS